MKKGNAGVPHPAAFMYGARIALQRMNQIDSLTVYELARLATASGLVSRIDREGRQFHVSGKEFDLLLDESKTKAFLRLIVFRADRQGAAHWARENAA